MILARVNHQANPEELDGSEETFSSERSFIQANTVPATLEDIRRHHVIPVFLKDNECAISHGEFVETVSDAVAECFYGERILRPSIRLSHPIKGRVPEAKAKPVDQLQEWEKTVYYERMMFVIEIPTVSDSIDGNPVTLTIGGVKAYNLDNLYNRKGADEHFKVFAGFQNRVCTNLAVWSDGLATDIKVKNLDQLRTAVMHLLIAYNPVDQVRRMQALVDHNITEQQFAQLIGRCRMYQHLPAKQKEGIEPLLFGDQQVSAICRDYYRDKSFCRASNGDLNLWRLHNLITGCNKSTFIDQFLERSVSASKLVEGIRDHVTGRNESWFIS